MTAPTSWPKQTVKPVEPMDPKRPTIYETWAALGRVEPKGA